MNRSIGIERTFVLGQYKNLKVSDFISGISEEVALNPELMGHLRMLQLIQVDRVYLKYLQKSLTLGDVDISNPDTIEELLAEVNSARVSTLESIKEAFASVEETLEEPLEKNVLEEENNG